MTLSDFRHNAAEIRQARWQVLAGRDLRFGDPLRAELLDRGVVQEQPTGMVMVTPPGFELCEIEARVR